MLLNTTGVREAIYKDGLIYVGSERLYFESHADESLAQSVLKDCDEMIFYTSYPYFHVAKKDDYNKYQEKQKITKVKQEKYLVSGKYEAKEKILKNMNFGNSMICLLNLS